MKDEDFDLLIKRQIQKDTYIPEKINHLFANFENEVNMKKNQKNKIGYSLRKGVIAASSILVMFLGGCTYAHINGTETIISPLLRNLGINSKYEENATKFDEETTKQDIAVKMLDGAMDDTTFIVGYEIGIPDINLDKWIEMEGNYKINNVNITPINTSISKTEDGKFLYYQVFDMNELKIKDTKNVKIDVNIYKIKEYTEYEDIDSSNAAYEKIYEDKWELKESIEVKNLETSKTYEFPNTKSYEIAENFEISVTEFTTGSYANILKIQTDKTNYDGDSIEKYYKLLDENNNEIGIFTEEERQYDERKYNDRIINEKINKNSKVKLEVYCKEIGKEKFEKVVTIPINLSNAVEKSEDENNLKEYKNDEYSFKYKEDWSITPKLSKNDVGPNSAYIGALRLEIPSTTNSLETSSIYIKTVNDNITLNEYIKEEKEQNENEYMEVKSTSKVKTKNQEGYQVVYELTDGETIYIMQSIYLSTNDKIYEISFSGSEKEYNNLESDINEFISNFEV